MPIDGWRGSGSAVCGRGQAVSEFVGGEWTVLTFPLGDALSSCGEAQAMCGGVGRPGADRGAFGGGGLLDGFGEVVGQSAIRRVKVVRDGALAVWACRIVS